jgi:hypothetical protein
MAEKQRWRRIARQRQRRGTKKNKKATACPLRSWEEQRRRESREEQRRENAHSPNRLHLRLRHTSELILRTTDREQRGAEERERPLAEPLAPIYICIYTYIYMYVCMYICMYMYVYIRIERKRRSRDDVLVN